MDKRRGNLEKLAEAYKAEKDDGPDVLVKAIKDLADEHRNDPPPEPKRGILRPNFIIEPYKPNRPAPKDGHPSEQDDHVGE